MDDSSLSNLIEVHRFETAQDFIATLSPSYAYWQPDPTLWMFRGHADDSWELYAKAHRPGANSYEAFGVELDLGSGRQEWASYADAEEALLARFRRALDGVGLSIPTRAPVRDSYRNERSSSADTPPASVPLLALAQHFGLPTKLLDWTRHARIAGYFAASEGAEKPNAERDIAIWALRIDFVESLNERAVDKAKLSIQTAPASSNPNLHAQQGFFTRLSGENAHGIPLDQYVQRAATEARSWTFKQWQNTEGRNPNKVPRPLMRRLSLPQTEAPRLLRLLSYEGVTGATMFPGYAGVVRALREEALWDIRPPVRRYNR